MTGGVSEVGVGDLDGDGVPDGAQGEGFDLQFFEGIGNGTYEPRQTVPLSASPTQIEFRISTRTVRTK